MDWMHLAQEMDEWWDYVNTIMQGCTNFPNILEAPHNSWRQTGNTKQVPYRGPTNIRRHRTKFSLLFDLAPIFVHPCYNERMRSMQGGKFLYDLNDWLGSEDVFCSKELFTCYRESCRMYKSSPPHVALLFYCVMGVHFVIDPVSCRPPPPPPPPPPTTTRGRVREPYPPLLQTASHLLNAN
jgi:hypothetical protein